MPGCCVPGRRRSAAEVLCSFPLVGEGWDGGSSEGEKTRWSPGSKICTKHYWVAQGESRSTSVSTATS